MPFSNPIIGGGGSLVYPSIHSPDYVNGVSGWSIMKDGNAQFSNLQLIGGLLELFNTNDQLLMYTGPPAAGNLIFSLSNVATQDQFNNPIPFGVGIGENTLNQILLNPNLNSQVSLTASIFGFLQSVMQLTTTDTNEEIAGIIGSVIFGTGSAAKMATAITSPIGTGTGAMMLLQAQNDGNTDLSSILLASITTPDESSITVQPMATFSQDGFAFYAAGSSFQIVTKTSGSGTIPVPSNANATAKTEAWGGGGGGHCGVIFPTNGNGGEYGGAGGEYASVPSDTVTPGGTLSYSVGTGSLGTAPGQGTPGNGANSTIGTAIAHGATITGNLPIGGTGSTNPIHFNGGNGGTNSQADVPPPDRDNGGSGGGSSAGTGAHGNNGNNTSGNSGANGATAPSGGGNGGKGGKSGTNGANGAQPGGGGGGGWANTGGANSAGNGGNGQVRVTFVLGTAVTPIASFCNTSFTDQFGNVIPAGTILPGPDPTSYNSGPSIKLGTAGQVISGGQTQIGNILWNVEPGTYWVEGVLSGLMGATSSTVGLRLDGTATASEVYVNGILSQLGALPSVTESEFQAWTGLGVDFSSPTFTNGFTYGFTFQGFITISSAGTLRLSDRATGFSHTIQHAAMTLTPKVAA